MYTRQHKGPFSKIIDILGLQTNGQLKGLRTKISRAANQLLENDILSCGTIEQANSLESEIRSLLATYEKVNQATEIDVSQNRDTSLLAARMDVARLKWNLSFVIKDTELRIKARDDVFGPEGIYPSWDWEPKINELFSRLRIIMQD